MEPFWAALKDTNPTHREIYTELWTLLLKQYPGVEEGYVVSPPLKSPMAYAPVARLAFQLTIQLHALERRGYTLLFWQPSDILVLQTGRDDNNTLYLLGNLTQMVPLEQKDVRYLRLIYPTVFPLPSKLCAPELLEMSALPFVTHRGASYYSLALLCLHFVHLSLEQLKGTSLFYFLERCLQEEPGERVLLFL